MSDRQSILHHGLGIVPDLDAHTYNWIQKKRTGEYFYPFPNIAWSAVALVANDINFSPLIVPRAITIDRLAIEVTVAGAAGKIARLGIYNDGTNMYPGTLVIDAGTVAVDAIAIVAATISQALTKGLYWLAVVSDGTPTVWTIKPVEFMMGLDPTNFHNTAAYAGWYKAAVGAGALADPAVSGALLMPSYAQLVAPRLLTLD